MDSQFGSTYPLPYPQSTQSPAQQAPMGNYAGLSQQPQQSSQAGSSHQSSGQQDSTHPTLPPLQSQNGYAQFGSLSYGHPNSGAPTPTAHTPTSSSLTNGPSSAYSHVSPLSAMGPPNGFSSHYASSQPMMYPSPTSTSMPHAGNLRPVLPANPNALPSLSSAHLGQHNAFMQNEEAPTHVVGSQGRRGILPSAPGRPNATASGPSIKNMMPVKDADGKFPCPHCNKTYLHAKHLKRHMLRHTGDRPYSCHLCKDTFSRSDILKRHFQKCSIRRGNPTGANHLAHQRRNNNGNRLSVGQQDAPIGLAALTDVNGASYAGNGLGNNSPIVNGDMSTRTSRANSLISPAANMSHRNSLNGLGIVGNNNATGPGANDPLSGQGAAFTPNMHTYGLPSVSQTSIPSAYAFSSQPSINGAYFQNPQSTMPYLGHQAARFDHSHSNSPGQQSPVGEGNHSHLDSGRIFGQSDQDSYLNGNGNSQNAENINIKTEHDVKHFPNDINNELTSNGSMGVVWS